MAYVVIKLGAKLYDSLQCLSRICHAVASLTVALEPDVTPFQYVLCCL